MLTLIVSSLVALVVSTLCSLVEAVLLSLSPSQVAELTRRHPAAGAIWTRLKAGIERPISAILILNTTAHTVGAAVAGAAFDGLYGARWIWLFSLVFTFLMLQLTEILPKTVGVARNRDLAPFLARPLDLFATLLHPVVWFTRLLNRPFERKVGHGERPCTLEEISALAGLASLAREINPHQERIIRGVSRLSQVPVRQVMLPLEQVSFLSADQSLAEALVAAHRDAHTRYPVRETGEPLQVLGYVNFKEIVAVLRTNPRQPSLRGIIRPLQFVPSDVPAADLLRAFVDEHVHIAMVRDAAGGLLGLVTFEDLVEELVGDIQDEFDRLPRHFHALPQAQWLVGGGLAMKEVGSRVGVPLPTDAPSLSQWTEDRLGRPPQAGDEFVVSGLRVTVRRVRRNRVFEVALARTESSTDPR